MVDRTEAERFVAEQRAVELGIAKRLARRSPAVAAILVTVAAVWKGWPGALAAAMGIVVVVGNYLLSGWLMSRAARVGFVAYQAAALGGFLVRLGLIAASMYAIVRVLPVDRLVLGISVAVGYLALLVVEAFMITARARSDNA